MNFLISRLSDRAVAVKLTIKRASLTRRDDTLTAGIQNAENDTSLTVTTKLFRQKGTPIYGIMRAVDEVYTYHVKHTLPYVDAGPRLLPSGRYFDYAKEMRHRMAVVDGLLKTYMPHYDALVVADIASRNTGHAASRASVNDYPTAEQFEAKMAFDMSFTPLPDESHPLFDLSDEDKKSFQEHTARVIETAKGDVIQRMLEPLKHLVAKLRTPIGAEKSVFRDSAIENVVEGCKLARQLMLESNPALEADIAELEQAATTYTFAPDMLRERPESRDAAADRLAAIAEKMKGYFGEAT